MAPAVDASAPAELADKQQVVAATHPRPADLDTMRPRATPARPPPRQGGGGAAGRPAAQLVGGPATRCSTCRARHFLQWLVEAATEHAWIHEVNAAPTYVPTDEDWRDPMAYIESIRAEAAEYGEASSLRLPDHGSPSSWCLGGVDALAAPQQPACCSMRAPQAG